MQRVVRVRDPAFCEDQWFAEHGFAVRVTDGRGTPGRGPEWSKTMFGDTLSAPLEDQVEALDAVAAQFADLDRGRVGIRGWSDGGALAAIAVIRSPDVFHAAVSGAAPHDQRLYDTHWRTGACELPVPEVAASGPAGDYEEVEARSAGLRVPGRCSIPPADRSSSGILLPSGRTSRHRSQTNRSQGPSGAASDGPDRSANSRKSDR